MRCDQCEAARINGVFCHETGCPNSHKTWVPDRGWVQFVECSACGSDVEAGTTCDCYMEEWEPERFPEDEDYGL